MSSYHKTTLDNLNVSMHAGRKRKPDYLDIGSNTYHGNHEELPNGTVRGDGGSSGHRIASRLLKASEIVDVVDRGLTEYSQRKALALTPNPTANPLLDLSHPAYGLPAQLVMNLASLGIRSIYPWQSDCLLRSGALSSQNNLVYTAPTGGGKSLVADIVMLKRVVDNPGQKALLVLPYVALVQEKTRWLRRVVHDMVKPARRTISHAPRPNWMQLRGNEDVLSVGGFFGGSKSSSAWTDVDIAVCTIGKANSLINTTILEPGNVLPSIVVMDELHMVHDEHQGYLLELLASKLLSLRENVQLIGMSATLRNAELLAKWLTAKFYISRYRPVQIHEHVVFDNKVYATSTSGTLYRSGTQSPSSDSGLLNTRAEPLRIIGPSQHKELQNALTNSVVALACETARAGHGVLVFCSSRLACERDALLISQVFPSDASVDPVILDQRKALIVDLRSTGPGLDHILEQSVMAGVAFHHAGLTTEERDLIATAFDEGGLRVLVATCSLAAGINLPARRVILHGAFMGADLVGPSLLRQMKGRAGRKGKDEIGETYLCCNKSDLEAVTELMTAELPQVESCLIAGKRGLKRALLEVMATRIAISEVSIHEYMRNTLLYHTVDGAELKSMIEQTVHELSMDGLIIQSLELEYETTLLGQAIVASSMCPEDGLFIHRELRKALQALVLDGEMHILYSFTPVQASHKTINWQIFRDEVERFEEVDLRVLGFIGVQPATINKMAQGGSMKESTSEEAEQARIYRRFYAALQLRDLCNEMPIYAVARKYDIPRGMVQNLAQACHGFAAGMIKFCQRMNWGGLAAVLDHFSDRLKAGARSDLLALAKVTYVKSRTARVFWENGFKSVAALAAADIKDILPILMMAQHKKPRTTMELEDKYAAKLKSRAEAISVSANKIWEMQMQQEIEEEE